MKYYLCEICGNLVELVEEGGGELVCCGQPMKELVTKTTDEGNEKHLPVVEINGNEVKIRIGSTPHPMTPEHHINWVAISYNGKCQMAKLAPESIPEVSFTVNEELNELKVYSYCNIHGLWLKK